MLGLRVENPEDPGGVLNDGPRQVVRRLRDLAAADLQRERDAVVGLLVQQLDGERARLPHQVGRPQLVVGTHMHKQEVVACFRRRVGGRLVERQGVHLLEQGDTHSSRWTK